MKWFTKSVSPLDLHKTGKPGTVLQVRGLKGSAFSFLIHEIIENTGNQVLLVENDYESALNAVGDLNSLSSGRINFLPIHEANNPLAGVSKEDILQERIETLEKISSHSNSRIIITYPAALLAKVPDPGIFERESVKVHTGENLSLSFLEEFLESKAFQRSEYVLEPGQFAIRGGILDVFSFSAALPFRIELYGETVESIRSFDPVTQLSKVRSPFVILTPDVTRLEVEQKWNCLPDLFSDSGTVIAIRNSRLLLESCYELSKGGESLPDNTTAPKGIIPDSAFSSPELLREAIRRKCVLEMGENAIFTGETILFNQIAQPSFGKNFNLLFQHLEENKKSGIKNFIFTDSEKQADRLRQILADLSGSGNVTENLFTTLQPGIHEGFLDRNEGTACYTDHEFFERYHRFKRKKTTTAQTDAFSLKEIQRLQPGDFVVHIDHGIGRYAGLEKIKVGDKYQEAVKLLYKDNDSLYVNITSLHRISKYSGKEGQVPRTDKLGSGRWQILKQKTKARVRELAFDLIKLYAERKASKGFAFEPDNYLQHELEASFIYEDTPDQIKSVAEVKRDMESDIPMDRLLCGDVGFGKTEIAVRAAFKAACNGKQTAILVPTTILALQHFSTFSERLKDLPCSVDYVNRFKSTAEVKKCFSNLQEGKTDIIIGTHKLLNQKIKFKDLGLLIVDEEQKFGVSAKDKLKLLRKNVDTLTLTATPIPRTLQFSLLGARDLSVIATPPPNRFPIETELLNYSESIIKEAILREISRGGQIFFIHNQVSDIQAVCDKLRGMVPEAKMRVGHGQMDGADLEEILVDFMEGYFDVLVSTTIIESGLDIPNANTMIIHNAQNFGLSDLHQIRGRVGRSNKKAYCYVLVPSLLTLTEVAKKRLRAITTFTELGSGFQVAMRDLDIRGAGDMLGGEQSGFINDMGFDTYMKILNEAVEEVRNEDAANRENNNAVINAGPDLTAFGKVFVKDAVLETDFEMLIPAQYVENSADRLDFYKQLDEAASEEDLKKIELELQDRFGPCPTQVKSLFQAIGMRRKGKELGIEKISLKGNKMSAYFISKQDSQYYNSEVFKSILRFSQLHPQRCAWKESGTKFYLIVQNITSAQDAMDVFNAIENQIPAHAK